MSEVELDAVSALDRLDRGMMFIYSDETEYHVGFVGEVQAPFVRLAYKGVWVHEDMIVTDGVVGDA